MFNMPFNPFNLSPDKLYDYMMTNNPKFAQFVSQNKGKSVDQIAKDYNINLNDFYKMIGQK